MNYPHSYDDRQYQGLDSLAEQGQLERQLRLQICSEALIQSKDIILGALAWKGFLEYGRSLVIVDLTNTKQGDMSVDVPMGIMAHNDSQVNLFEAEKVVGKYDPQSEGVLIMYQEHEDNLIAYICIFTPSYPPRVCYQELMNRPSEFDFSFAN